MRRLMALLFFCAFCFGGKRIFTSEFWENANIQEQRLIGEKPALTSELCGDGQTVKVMIHVREDGSVRAAELYRGVTLHEDGQSQAKLKILTQELISMAVTLAKTLKYRPMPVAGKNQTLKAVVNFSCYAKGEQ